MIQLDAPTLYLEVQAAEKERKKHLTRSLALVKKFVGNWWREDHKGKPVPENLIFSYLATMLPALIFDNPQVTVSAKRSETHRPIAEWMKMAINGWIKEVALRDQLEQVCVDMLLGFGMAKVGIEARGDFSTYSECGVFETFTMHALTPYFIRVSPGTAIIDAECQGGLEKCRLIGHQFSRDIEDMRQDDRYDQDVVAKLSGEGEQQGLGVQQTAFKKGAGSGDRNRVTLYELYLPEYRKVCTIALNANGEGEFIRPPADYVGPKDGPYVLFGVYSVPDCVYPLSPIAAMAEQFMELNAHATAAATEASTHKKIVLVDANNPNLAAEIHRAPAGSVVQIPNLNASAVSNIEIGGTSDTRLKYIEALRNRTDRIVGTSDAQRGKAANVTATEANIVNADSDARTEFIHLKYREGVKRGLGKVGWYMFHDPAVVMPVSSVDDMTGQTSEGLFIGGPVPGQDDASWTDFFLEIEPYSMRRIDPVQQQQQAMQMFEVAMQVAPMIVQAPWINWRALLDDIGEASNVPDFATRILSQQGMAMIQNFVQPGMMPSTGAAPPAQLPGGVNQNLAAATMGAPTNNFMPPAAARPAPAGPPMAPGSRPGSPAAAARMAA